MSGADAEIVMQYCGQIKAMRRILRKEREELESGYNTIHGTGMDGMPKAPGAGDVVGETATRLAEEGVADRLQELDVRDEVLRQDMEDIGRALRVLRDVYSQALTMHYRDRHKWREVAGIMKYSESHILRLRRRALEMLGEQLEAVPMAEELLARARDARA